MTATDTALAEAQSPHAERRSSARPQVLLLGAQLATGASNLLVAVAFARVLPSDDYADVAAFLALYLLIHVPAAALAAAGALDPERLHGERQRITALGGCAAVAVAVAADPLGGMLGLPVPLVVLLAVAVPGATMLGLERGLAYGQQRHRTLAASLVAEPVARLALGVALAATIGPAGAAVGTVLGGYAALVVCRRDAARRATPTGDGPARPAPEAVGTAVVFVLLAVLQSIDLLVANHRLAPDDAARFSVLSTLGGAAAFATATIPLVLLPAAARREPRASATALVLAGGLGVAITAFGATAARPLVTGGFGEEYEPAARLLAPYLVAMACIGIVRVLAAQRCAAGESRFVVAATAGVLAADAVALVAFGTSVTAVATTTLVSSAALATVLAFPDTVRAPAARLRTRAVTMPTTGSFVMLGLMALAAVLRTATDRGLWVDEAISVHQAQMPFGRMLDDMQTTDVHPPFHHALLWVTVRVFGTSEFAVRLPSLIAGVALVPALYWAGKVIYDRRTGWVAATLAMFAPFCVWYAQEARMYAQFMLFATIAVAAQVQAIRRGRGIDWAVYALSTAAMLWTQYFAFLPLIAQQLGFVAAWWNRRRKVGGRRRLVLGWLAAMAAIVVVCLPLLAFVRGQFLAYTNRSDGLVPGQAGAGSSTLGDTISVYAVGANLIWTVLGYHSDVAMEQIAALWPLGMLAVLVMLGRGRSGASLLLLALVVVPMAALFAIGSMKRDLFELRYFSGAVPAALLLLARMVTATTRRRAALLTVSGLVVLTMAAGLLDQQRNGANPRLYDFQGALAEVQDDAGARDVLLYEPAYLADVIQYYAPGLEAVPLGTPVPQDATTVWVLATDRVVNSTDTAAKVGGVLSDLEQQRQVVDTFERPNVKVWELR